MFTLELLAETKLQCCNNNNLSVLNIGYVTQHMLSTQFSSICVIFRNLEISGIQKFLFFGLPPRCELKTYLSPFQSLGT